MIFLIDEMQNTTLAQRLYTFPLPFIERRFSFSWGVYLGVKKRVASVVNFVSD